MPEARLQIVFHPGTAHLQGSSDSVSVTEVELTEQLTIGRDRQWADLRLSDQNASRSHAIVSRMDDNHFYVNDVGSSNGTYVNGNPISTAHRLKSGDQIQIGDTFLVFLDADQPPVSTDVQHSLRPDLRTQRVFSERSISVLVSDIRNFTKLSENTDTDILPTIISNWFREVGKIVKSNGGIIEKFRGDSFMAFWLAESKEDKTYIEKVLNTAIQIVERSKRYSDEVMPRLGQEFAIGCGVNLGSGTIGNIGADSRRDITILGDAINTTFRIESLCASTGRCIIVSEEIQKQATDRFKFEDLGPHELKGKANPENLFALER